MRGDAGHGRAAAPVKSKKKKLENEERIEDIDFNDAFKDNMRDSGKYESAVLALRILFAQRKHNL